MKCPYCGTEGAYVGLNVVECPKCRPVIKTDSYGKSLLPSFIKHLKYHQILHAAMMNRFKVTDISLVKPGDPKDCAGKWEVAKDQLTNEELQQRLEGL
jgi:hypothetical protein